MNVSNKIEEDSIDKQQDWHWQLAHRLVTLEQVSNYINLTVEEKKAIQYSRRLRMAITPYFASLIDNNDINCPIRKQCIPSLEEFRTSVTELDDPCGEIKDTVTPNLIHRYPDRVVLLITDTCATYCRYCTRRRLVGSSEKVISQAEFDYAVEYISQNKRIRDVLLSGGDPFILSDERLDFYLSRLRKVPHIEILRIGTRVPVTLPQRITNELCTILKKYHPLYINIHFSHPKEITEKTKQACEMLADAGIPLGSQTVLLKGVNDKPYIMMKLVHELIKIRVKPYYLYQCDLALGTAHFRTPISTGIRIIEALRGYTTGFAVPTYVIDAPNGGGKVPINPEYIISKSRKGIIFKNYEGKVFVYPENGVSVASIKNNFKSRKDISDTVQLLKS